MTENREMYHQDYYYNSSASSPFSIADPYQQLMATPADQYYTPTMATTTTAYPEYYHGSSSMMTSADYATLARAVAGDHNQPASYYAFDADASAGGKRSPADMDALLMDSSALTAGAGGGGDGSTTGGSRTPVTPNSSVSSSSNEAAGQDEEHFSCRRGSKTAADNEGQDHLVEEGKAGESKSLSKKQAGGKAATGGAAGRKKGEKRPRQPRFAFMTKSEVDHLEDGYRWRKYGQKAVKNSPYPRSYYRCTTHKCTVKKRVERSHQDPSVVITTYEGQHTHPSPAALRGAAAGAALTHSHMLAAAAAASQVQSPMPGFRRDLLMLHHQQQMQQQQQQRDLVMPQAQDDATSNPMHLLQHRQYHEAPSSDHRYHQQEVAGHQGGTTEGLLQDMVLPSSSFFNENMLQQSYNWNS